MSTFTGTADELAAMQSANSSSRDLYPRGYGYPSRLRNVLCQDGKLRTARLSPLGADTFFSVPARVSANGRTVSGYVTRETFEGFSTSSPGDPEVWKFRAYCYGANFGAVVAPEYVAIDARRGLPSLTLKIDRAPMPDHFTARVVATMIEYGARPFDHPFARLTVAIRTRSYTRDPSPATVAAWIRDELKRSPSDRTNLIVGN